MTTSIMSKYNEFLARGRVAMGSGVNVNEIERWLSLVGGTGLAACGLRRGTLGGLIQAVIGGSLIYRGATGHCHLYGMLGVSTAKERGNQTAIPAGHGVKIEESITINAPRQELFKYWRKLENLPNIMPHLKSVKTIGGNRSHWTAEGPLGTAVEWDAEIISERANELIGWRSLPGSDIDTAGSVHFAASPDGRGTEVKVVLKYDPPAGKVGAMVASLFGEAPEKEIRDSLGKLKRTMETGIAARS